ncbi:MAG: metalloregulator ArsR/SmtB family transcription factor [Sulfurospirillaceae bacterium]|jgi:DNA-binding transcriptional ArsR family regulator|nr:metalloregulator ArsR/SmtB family transcription factor [Sulfurospirillaceae bacterium]MDY0238061.1 metalloregulator ArsR/SmtB family transcription factor [Campylobacterales bacterium]NLM99734.1 winged helix-turn-helix transcriptional regulator [Campylobacteraceae bacterium]
MSEELIRSCCEKGSVLCEVLNYLPKEEEVNELAMLLQALSDPTRLKIVLALQKYEMCVGEIANMLNVSPSNTSHQLKILRLAKIVTYKKEAQMYFYRLASPKIKALISDLVRIDSVK